MALLIENLSFLTSYCIERFTYAQESYCVFRSGTIKVCEGR